MTNKEYHKLWYQKHKDYMQKWSYTNRVKHYAKVSEEAKHRKYKFIKSYKHFVLLERLDNGCKECFHHGEYNQLEVID